MVELVPATLETQPSAVVERQPSMVVLGERSGSMAFTTSVGYGIDQEVMRRARSSHTLRSARVCVTVCVCVCVCVCECVCVDMCVSVCVCVSE